MTFVFQSIRGGERVANVMEIKSLPTRHARGAVIQTSLGEIEISYRHPSSKGAEVFSLLGREGVYDQTRIQRVVNDFLMEGGKSELQFTFPDEVESKGKMVRGVVAFANTGPNTSGSVFFILVQDASFLDGDYTILGDVIRGMEVIDKITAQKTGVTGVPKQNIMIDKVMILEEQE